MIVLNLFNQIPIWASSRQRRDPTKLPVIKCKTERRRKAFICQSIQWWNELAKEIRESTTIESFKKKTKPVIDVKENWYGTLSRKQEVMLTKLR